MQPICCQAACSRALEQAPRHAQQRQAFQQPYQSIISANYEEYCTAHGYMRRAPAQHVAMSGTDRCEGGTGLVFTVACEPYLVDEYGHPADAPVVLQHEYLHGSQKQEDHQVGRPTPALPQADPLRVPSARNTCGLGPRLHSATEQLLLCG